MGCKHKANKSRDVSIELRAWNRDAHNCSFQINVRFSADISAFRKADYFHSNFDYGIITRFYENIPAIALLIINLPQDRVHI